MTVKNHDATTITGIKKKLEYKVEKAIKDSIKEAKRLRIKKIKVQSNNVIIRYDPNNVYVIFLE